jgi:hypothetical protein
MRTKTTINAVALVMMIACGSACSNTANKILFERHTVTKGTFRGFEIGMSKENASQNIDKLGVKKINDLQERHVCVISNTSPEPPSPYDLWEFYDHSVRPDGATYCLYFKDNRLIRIEYQRERVQVE